MTVEIPLIGAKHQKIMQSFVIFTRKLFMIKSSHAAVAPRDKRFWTSGTGTGVLPRNLYRYGAKWTAADISANQIAQAKRLSEGMQIDYRVSATEDLNFPNHSFDVITACQCFHYFDHARVAENFARMLKPNGRLLVLYMGWLPFEDEIAAASEKLVLKYNPCWSGAGDTVAPITVPDCYSAYFDFVSHEEYPLRVPFTRESWHGRIRSSAASVRRFPKRKL